MGSVRAEIELLLRCAMPPGIAGKDERIGALAGQALDWEYLLERAGRHAMVPLLYWELKRCRPGAISPALEDRFQENVRNCVFMARELIKLLDLLEQNGIAALPFKGPTLAIAAYGNLALRQFVDLDVLVRREDALKARSVLTNSGFRDYVRLAAHREESYLRVYDEFGLRAPGGEPLVEIHWAITSRYFSVPLNVGPFWNRSVALQVANRPIPSLCPEDLLMVLIVHGTKNCWSYLSLVSDVAWLVARQEIRWPAVVAEAQSLGCLRMLALGVELTRRLLGCPCPEELREQAGSRQVQALAAQVEAGLAGGSSPSESILQTVRFHMRSRENLSDKLRYLLRFIATPGVREWEIVDLPRPLRFLYVFFRFPRLIRKYFPSQN